MSRKELPRPGLVRAALAGQITNRQGAAALHVTIRQFQRLKARYREAGPAGLRHCSRGQPSQRRLAPELRDHVIALMTDRYRGFNDTHLTEKLREIHHLRLSRESVRRLRVAVGQPAVHRRRPAQHRQRRPREAARGALVQLDGSSFRWLEDRGPALTLLGAIDDATSQVLALHFRPTEDLHGYATLLHEVFTAHGLPLALYGDGVNILVRTDRHWRLEEELAGVQAPTHLGRVLQDLGIAYVQARSPQGKGRIERLWGTLQDRLVSELRVHRIASRAAANAFLPDFVRDFNQRFAGAPQDPRPVWRRPPPTLPLVLSCRYRRVVARDNTIRLGSRCIQLPPGPHRRSWARARVEVRELLDGRVVVFADGRPIATQPAPGPDFVLSPRRDPGHDRRRSAPSRPRPVRPLTAALTALANALPPIPRRRHPWRRPFSRNAPSLITPRKG